MTKKQLAEFIPLTIFLLAVIGVLLKLPFSTMLAAISGSATAMLYFYAALWLYTKYEMPKASKIIAGVFYSIALIACLFCLLRWPGGKFFGYVSYLGMSIMLAICLLNYKSSAYKQLLYRCVGFIVLLSIIYGYRRFSV
ncbi:hypothetical protein HDF24_07270 [Mucilaginibacter sp. X4EP1]|uniref:hypothetical protein n=1 Tax=Mucilaginibacter sp. X4EP1 TaxID=2723092 RepID=UPI0021685888|nr:hypothetical protein [Mucilaginibacter sp. X4EP1]MCS3814110.1 putative membrane protein [Mucilaginibacter sp. X4EP1]